MSRQNINLPAGSHNIKILFKTGNVNLNYIVVSKSNSPVYIKVLYPNGGEILRAGLITEILWESSKVDRMDIGLSTNNGGTWSFITSDCSAEFGSFRFNVPFRLSNNCRIMIVDRTNLAMNDLSDSVFVIASSMGISEKYPKNFTIKLFPTYPNPSNPETKVRFSLDSEDLRERYVRLYVYDINGKKISNPVNSRYSNGTYEVSLSNSGIATGIYEVVLEVENRIERTKMVVLK